VDVVLVVALEPDHLAVALEGQDVRRDAVEEPAVVGDHDGAAGEVQQRLLERPQRLDVEVVGRLVEQQHVGAVPQHLRQVHAVAFAARQLADLLLLLVAAEVEPPDIAARGGLVVADLDDVLTAGDLLPHGLRVIELVARLVDAGNLDGGAGANGAGIRLLGAGQHAEQRRLARAIRTDDADDGTRRELEGQVVDQQAFAVGLAQVLHLDHEVAEPRPRRDVDFVGLVAGLEFDRGQLVELAQARLALGLARLRVGAHPFEFARERAAQPFLLLLLLREALLLLLEPGRVIALPGDAVAAVEFEDPAGDVVEEVAVVGHADDGARVLLEVLLEPGDRFRVEVVGRLVEQQHVRLRQQQPAQRDAAALAA
jgi:hypothetical protein